MVQHLWSRTAAVILRSNLSEQCQKTQKTLRNRDDGVSKTIRKISHFNPGDSCHKNRPKELVVFPTPGSQVPMDMDHHGPVGWTCCYMGIYAPSPITRRLFMLVMKNILLPERSPIIGPAISWNNKINPLKLTSNICFASLIPPAMGPISWRKHTQTMFKLHITIIVP